MRISFTKPQNAAAASLIVPIVMYLFGFFLLLIPFGFIIAIILATWGILNGWTATKQKSGAVIGYIGIGMNILVIVSAVIAGWLLSNGFGT